MEGQILIPPPPPPGGGGGESKERNLSNGSSNGGGGGGGRLSNEEITVVQEMIDLIEAVGLYGDYRRSQRKDSYNLVRRMKLLIPLLEEIKEIENPIPEDALNCLSNLKKSLVCAKKLLTTCNEGSKIYLAFDSEGIMVRFHGCYDKISVALDEIPFDELNVSDEVKEQVELMRTQLKRAKRRTDTQDIELAMDMMVVFSKKDDRNADSAILERLAKKLELHTLPDLRAETVAVRKLVKERNGQQAESTQQIIDLLGKFKQVAGLEETDDVLADVPMPKTLEKCQSLAIPNEFLCPITLEIMTDPVIVASGQTYERESINKWFESNHRTCPATRQNLPHLSVAPNFALRNLILQWCEKNNFQLPKKEASADVDETTSEQQEEIVALVQNLSSTQLDDQRRAAKKIRMLSKENPENRVMIANAGGIPPLVQLLSYPDSKIQEHTVTALLNLSLDDSNKRTIATEGAIPAIIEVLQNGKIGARENSAACLFSLSMLDENKVAIGSMNGIPPLVDLLQHGTIRGKKDAATALFNLSLNQVNKARAIKAGALKPLLQLLVDKNLGMVDEALSILLLLVSHPEGRSEIGKLSFIETLVDFIRDGTPKNKECAVSVLLELGLSNSSFVLAALQYGVYEHLTELARSGTNRAQRKANSLLQHMSKCEHIP
ncbi:U-box domain-containing protein 15-like [Papaver somniferum]|nr:U-box domain-containing protein 15-like [Papaver somniferum]